MGKSWSQTRKELEQKFLCEKLRGRVQYFLTHYHGAPDRYGRFCVRIDGKEEVFANPYNEVFKDEYIHKFQEERGIPRREWTKKGWLHEEENCSLEREADRAAVYAGKMDICDITEGIQFYLQKDIQACINSEYPIVRMFAVLDRRVGKRTLREMKSTLQNQPEWLRKIYKLRFNAENI